MESVLGFARELWRNGDRFAALGAARKAVEIAPRDVHAQVVFAAMQRQVAEHWRDGHAWWRSSALNTARTGWFSADRAIREYAEGIWNVKVGLG